MEAGDWISRERRREVLRFIAVGASNTGGTFALFALLAFAMPTRYAYTCAFAVGLLYTTVLSSRVVFRVEATPKRQVYFVVWYLIVYFVGLGIIEVLERASASRPVVVCGVAVITVPLTYFGGRRALSKTPSSVVVADPPLRGPRK
jgi:putative flippase GtrA